MMMHHRAISVIGMIGILLLPGTALATSGEPAPSQVLQTGLVWTCETRSTTRCRNPKDCAPPELAEKSAFVVDITKWQVCNLAPNGTRQTCSGFVERGYKKRSECIARFRPGRHSSVMRHCFKTRAEVDKILINVETGRRGSSQPGSFRRISIKSDGTFISELGEGKSLIRRLGKCTPSGPVAVWSRRRTDTPACVVASRPAVYAASLAIPKALKEAIAVYKSGWRSRCAGKGGASFASLLEQARRIETAFKAVTATWRSDGSATAQTVGKSYAGFIPAFRGSSSRLSTRLKFSELEFLRNAPLGTIEDRYILARLEYLLPRWANRTGRAGQSSCVNIDAAPFRGSWAQFAVLKGKLRRPGNANLLHRAEARAREYWLKAAKSSALCACRVFGSLTDEILVLLKSDPVTARALVKNALQSVLQDRAEAVPRGDSHADTRAALRLIVERVNIGAVAIKFCRRRQAVK